MGLKKHGRTIFRVMLFPFLSVLALELLMFFGALNFGGVFSKLDQNEQDMMAQQVENRGNYLVNEMIRIGTGTDELSRSINKEVQNRIESGQLTLADLGSLNENNVEFLREIYPKIIDSMRSQQVSGLFVVLNTKDVNQSDIENLPGLYLRDLDPTALASENDEDLLVERAPTKVVQFGHVATDTGWQPVFSREDSVKKDYFIKPFTEAYGDKVKHDAKEYGYWTKNPYTLTGDTRSAIAYSMPLILEDGTVYGVVGVELLVEYVQSKLPYEELMEDKQGSYFLAVAKEGDDALEPVLLSSKNLQKKQLEELEFSLQSYSSGDVIEKSDTYYATTKKLEIYNNNAPFDSDDWHLIGLSSKEELFLFSGQMKDNLMQIGMLLIVVGFGGILLVSYRLSRPITNLSKEIENVKGNNCLPQLTTTKIREIDLFADAITRLGNEVIESSTRFLSIMNMASVELAGYELDPKTKNIYVTDNFFPLLGIDNIDVEKLTYDRFLEEQEKIYESLNYTVSDDGSVIFCVPSKMGVRYLRYEHKESEERCFGLMEDVTMAILEKMRIEKERDCDGLTSLLGRRGFRNAVKDLFLDPERLKCAGLLMMDLDNLKTTNDKYGHNFGDLYIQTAGKCFVDNTPEETVCARMSGDEFVVFFYGYDSKDEIRKLVKKLYDAIAVVTFVLPDGHDMGLHVSGGIAWYPDNAVELSDLMKLADFAMYQSKTTKKGTWREFDMEAYQEKLRRNQCKLEFHQMMDMRLVNYVFQPIFSGKDGMPYAYEALMRVNLPTLRSPDMVLSIAKEVSRMNDIERITLFRSAECYKELLNQNQVSKDALLFVNSISNVSLTDEEFLEFHQLHADLQNRIVIEITEAESLDKDKLDKKRNAIGFSGMLALDDYGSGYNSEINLLELHPKFIKVDITIVRDIHKDKNKQEIMNNIVKYAHEREMMIIAEGIEIAEELRMCLEIGVDLFQGYFLARPAEIPLVISEEAKSVIIEYQEQN